MSGLKGSNVPEKQLNIKAIAQEAGLTARWNDVRKQHHAAPLAAPQLQFIMERPSP